MSKPGLLERRGIIYIAAEFYNNNFDELCEVFRAMKLTILTTENNWERNMIRIIGVSPHFDVVLEGDIVRTYNISYSKNDSKKLCSFCGCEIDGDYQWNITVT